MPRTPWYLAFVLASGACVMTWAGSALSDRQTVLASARAQLAARAGLLEQHADRALEAADRALRAVVEAAGDPADMAGRAARLHERLRDIVVGNPPLGAGWVMDARGAVVAETRAHPPASRGLYPDRPYFQAHAGGERELHIGMLGAGPHGSRPRFTLSRPILTAEGEFAGVAAIGVFGDYFAAVFESAGLGATARLRLTRADGAPLATWPPEAGEAAPPPLPEGTLSELHRLARFPVVLEVSQPRDAVLADWRARTWRSGALVAAVVLVLAALTATGLRGVRRRQALMEALQTERAQLERRVTARTAALAESEARFREMADNAPVMVWVTDADGACTFLSRSWTDFTGQTQEQGRGQGWLDPVHPEDRIRAGAEFAAASARQAAFRLDYRLRRHDGVWRWAIDAASPRRGPDGAFLGYIGSVIDITERREAEERRALMARELDHRAKNALAVVQAALRLTPRDDAETYARAIEGRVAALARAHSVLAEGAWRGAPLGAVVQAELATFLAAEPGSAMPRARVSGPPVPLCPAAVQALSMALHELATNATKYGALSVAAGRLAVDWQVDATHLVLRWRETGGPPVGAAPLRRGFGTRVIQATITKQLGGRLEMAWEPDGLACTIILPLDRLSPGLGEAEAPLALAAE